MYVFMYVFVRVSPLKYCCFSGVASSLIVLLLLILVVVFILRRKKPQRVVKTEINDVYGVYYAGVLYFLVLMKLSN